MDTIKERCLTFKYGRNETTSQKAEELCKLLKKNNIDFVCYNKDSNYYSCSFIIRRCGKKWNDIMRLINSIQAAKYDYKTIDFYITDEFREVLGNIQEVVLC